MKDKSLLFSLLSVLIPLITYGFFFTIGRLYVRLSEPGVYASLFVSNIAGITLSLLALRKSNPTDTSRRTLVAVLLSSIAIFANTIAIEVVFTSVTWTGQLVKLTEFFNAAWINILAFLENKLTWTTISAAILILIVVISLKKRFKKVIEIHRGWVTFAVAEFEKNKINISCYQRLLNFAKKFRHPSIVSLLGAPIALLLAWMFQWILAHYVWPCPNQSSASNNIMNSLLTLWQVQVGLAGAALPILIFVIEMTKDEGRAATKSSEILIRETWIFPIIVLALSTAFKIGCDIYLNPASESAEVVDLLLFSICISLTIFAYYRAMRLMFSPALLRGKSIKLMKEKMEESILFSAKTRVGNNWLIKNLKEDGIEWYPFSANREERERFYVVEAQRLGQIVDINIENFRAFKEQLDMKSTRSESRIFGPQDSETAEQDSMLLPRKRKQVIFIAKIFRDYVTDRGRALILIERSALNSFDKFDADQWANKRIFKIEATDER